MPHSHDGADLEDSDKVLATLGAVEAHVQGQSEVQPPAAATNATARRAGGDAAARKMRPTEDFSKRPFKDEH